MRAEHERGRQLLARMLAALERFDRHSLGGAARQLIEHLRQHIAKEDEILFPLARQRLDAPATAELQRAFDAMARDLDAAAHARCLTLVDELEVEAAS